MRRHPSVVRLTRRAPGQWNVTLRFGEAEEMIVVGEEAARWIRGRETDLERATAMAKALYGPKTHVDVYLDKWKTDDGVRCSVWIAEVVNGQGEGPSCSTDKKSGKKAALRALLDALERERSLREPPW